MHRDRRNQAWLLKKSTLLGGANQFAGGSCTPLKSSAFAAHFYDTHYCDSYPVDHRWCTLSGSMKLLMMPVAALVIALYLWTPKTGKGVAIYGGIVLAMLIVYFALRG
jgi:hypothetical protein